MNKADWEFLERKKKRELRIALISIFIAIATMLYLDLQDYLLILLIGYILGIELGFSTLDDILVREYEKATKNKNRWY